MKSGKKAGRQGIGPRNPAPRRAARAAAPRLPSEPRPAARPSAAHGRQRLRLIDACISALHIHGPSRTTVEKVVAIANMSPGIVRFYFDSKAAMLVASLQFLAAEFERRVLEPVAMLKADPVAALERLVDLYLDPEIASPRKVAVWYAFWGEASSRQEYYDICGQKDDRFAALVRELIERLIIETQRPHLDPDGVALGLIGVLEMLWQGFAFQAEVNTAAWLIFARFFRARLFPRRCGVPSPKPAQRVASACRAGVSRAPPRTTRNAPNCLPAATSSSGTSAPSCARARIWRSIRAANARW
jgi:TetR/AcrR family transcriptional repressor of bet genes